MILLLSSFKKQINNELRSYTLQINSCETHGCVIMPQCAAFGCTNRTGRNNDPPDVSFHSFPLRDDALLKQWVRNVGRQAFKPTRASKLCSAHFLPSCFKEDVFEKYGLHSKEKTKGRLLKEGAVPTEFSHRPTSQVTRTSSVSQMEKRDKQRQTKQLLSVSTSQESTDMPQHFEESSTFQPEATKHVGPLPVKKRKKTATVGRAEAELQKESTEQPEQTDVFAERIVTSESQSLTEVPRKQLPVLTPSVTVQYGTPRRTKKDHSYASQPIRTYGTQTEVLQEFTEAPADPEPQSSSPFTSSPFRSESGIEAEETLAEYLPSSPLHQSSENNTSDSDNGCTGPYDPCNMKKYIVFEDNLAELVKFCKECGSPIVESKKFTRGSMVGFNLTCHSGHSYVWQSQPLDRQQPVGNLLIAAAIMISGNTYAKIHAFAELLNLLLISKSVYNKIQKSSSISVIQQCWTQERLKAVEVRSHGAVVLGGDGRCDSPGHTAKYGSYTLMETDGDGKVGSRKIVSMQLVQVSEVKNSNNMEPEGLKRCLGEIADDGLTAEVLATDRHVMVTSMMKKDCQHINYQFDTWHLAKGIVKKLTAKAKQKDCIDLSPWIQSVSNHLWWSCATCNEDDQILREKWLSILQHVTNKHEWCGNQKFHSCAHGPLSASDKREIQWLKPHSPAFKALRGVVTDKLLLKTLPHLTTFCHTGELEIFHSMLLKYCPKRQYFHYDAMYARLMLAALDWNGTKREEVTDKSGKPATSVTYSKRRKVFVLKKRYTKVKSDHMYQVLKTVYKIHRDNVQLPGIKGPDEVHLGIATVPKPGRSELERQFRSRFQ